MCVSFPGQVVAVGPEGAVVRTQGQERRASTLLHPDVREGEWVLVAVGTIVQRLTDDEAASIHDALREAVEQADTAAATTGGGSPP